MQIVNDGKSSKPTQSANITYFGDMAAEARVQTGLKNYLERYRWLVVKFEASGHRGYPDLLALRDGKAMFVEVKALGEKPTSVQEYRIAELRRKGFRAIWVDSLDMLKKKM